MHLLSQGKKSFQEVFLDKDVHSTPTVASLRHNPSKTWVYVHCCHGNKSILWAPDTEKLKARGSDVQDNAYYVAGFLWHSYHTKIAHKRSKLVHLSTIQHNTHTHTHTNKQTNKQKNKKKTKKNTYRCTC